MGHYADRFPGKTNGVNQIFYLNTGDAMSFARKYYMCLKFNMLCILPCSVKCVELFFSTKVVNAPFQHGKLFKSSYVQCNSGSLG